MKKRSDNTILSEAIAAIAAAGDRTRRSAAVEYYAGLLGMSSGHLRRLASSRGVETGYARRRDAGVSRDAARDEACRAVADLIVSMRGKAGTLSAIDLARRIGRIPADLPLQTYHVNRWMQANGIHRSVASGPLEHRRCKWGEVNDVHQVDSTNCVQWFFVEDDGAIRATRAGEVYHNKPADPSRPVVLRYILIEPVSSCFRVRYYQTTGETAQTILQFLHWCWTPCEHADRLPLAGLPKSLVLDKGPGNASSYVRNLCAELGIDMRFHATGHSWAKGSVERTMSIWEEAFESELRIWPAANIDELNERAYAANVRVCGTRIHTRHGMTRAEFFARNLPAGQIVYPPLWQVFVDAAASNPRTARVGSYMLIRVDGREYYAGSLPGVSVGDTVNVRKNILDWDDETCPMRLEYRGHTVIERAQARTSAGELTDDRLFVKRGDEAVETMQAAPELRLAEARQACPSAPDIAAQIAAAPAVGAPAAAPRIVLRPVASAPAIRRSEAMMTLCDRLGRELTEFEVAGLGWTGELVPACDVDEAVRRLSSRRDAETQRRAANAG